MTPQYAAGFFDGEGCVNCSSGRKDRPFIRTLVVNTNIEVLKEFQSIWGGDINANYKAKPNWKQAYTWRLSHKAALLFLQEIQPYLLVKQKQVELAIEFFELRPGQGYKWTKESEELANSIIDKIRTANKKGVEITLH